MNQRIAFITGAASGIGFEIARQFALKGYSVVIADLSPVALEQAISILRNEKLEVTGMICDVSIETDLQQGLNECYKKFGRLDILINNAGFQFVSLVEEFPTEKFEQMIRVMLVAPFVAAKQVFPWMKQQGFGRIINMASINGLIGFAGKAAYNSAKHGVIGLTKVLALEGATFNITANALCPGYVNTDLLNKQLSSLAKTRNISVDKVMEELIYTLVPQKRLLTVQEVARYALFLAGEESGGITGQAVVIDGGYTVQ